MITTAKEKDEDDAMELLVAKESWMVSLPDEMNEANTSHKTKKQYNDPDHAFPLANELSVGTIHEKAVATAAAAGVRQDRAPDGTPLLYLGKAKSSPPKDKEVVVLDDTDDDMSTMSAMTSMTKDQLIALVMQQQNHSRSSVTGYPPQQEHDIPHTNTTNNVVAAAEDSLSADDAGGSDEDDAVAGG